MVGDGWRNQQTHRWWLIPGRPQHGTEKAIREAGKLRSEGRAYVMQDGDVVHFLFNV